MLFIFRQKSNIRKVDGRDNDLLPAVDAVWNGRKPDRNLRSKGNRSL